MNESLEVRHININDIQTAEYVVGSGVPVIILHGWGANISLVKPLADKLAAQGYQAFAPDLPGFGQTPAPNSAWTVQNYAAFIVDYFAVHNLSRAHLIGHSFGGRLGLILGADHADKLEKLVLIDSAGVPPRRSGSSQFRLSLYKSVRDVLYKFGAKSTADKLRDWYVNRYGSADYKNAGALRETVVKVVNEDLLPYAARIRVPTLLLWGEDDEDTPLWQGQILEKTIPDAGLVTFPNAGHYSYLQHLAETVRIVDYFFKQS
jgi:pimeloyl-ACP methyl ester carboxylesterase